MYKGMCLHRKKPRLHTCIEWFIARWAEPLSSPFVYLSQQNFSLLAESSDEAMINILVC